MGWIIPMLAKHFRFPVAIWAAIAICLLLWPPQLPPGEVGWIFPILVDLVCLSPNGTREPEVFTNLGSFSCQTLQVSSGNLSCHWNLLASVAFPAPPGWRGWDFSNSSGFHRLVHPQMEAENLKCLPARARLLAKHFRFPLAFWAIIGICLRLWPFQPPLAGVSWIFPILVDLADFPQNWGGEPEVFVSSCSVPCHSL